MTTHVFFDTDQLNFGSYLQQSQQGEGDDQQQIFRGVRYQRGGWNMRSGLESIGRFLKPIATNLGQAAKSEAQSALTKVATDVTEGKSLRDALREQGKTALQNLGAKVQQCGKGGKRRGRRKKIKELALSELGGIQEPTEKTPHEDSIVTGPNPVKMYRQKKRSKDYLDI
jgi:hypothetical protein